MATHRSWTLVVGALAVTAVLGAGDPGAQAAKLRGVEQLQECAATPVHWRPRKNIGTRTGLVMPWIAASPPNARVIGYLNYYAPRSAIAVLHLPGVVIYTRGRTPERGTTSILWVPERNTGLFLTMTGRRLDGPGTFRQRTSSGSAGVYPSALNVPTPGCWRVTLRSRNLLAHVVFRAYDSS